MKKRILVIEDDAAIRRGVVDALRFDGYEVEQAGDRAAGVPMAVKADAALLLLDLVLPDGSGLDVLREVRATRPTLPVIIMTAKGAESDRVAGLRLGADDYVVKPFSVLELLARVEAVLRRSAERPADVRSLQVGGATIDLDRREVRFNDGERAELSEREADLLRYLVANPGRAIARDELLARVWRINPRAIVQTRTIDMHITALRGKLRDDSTDPRIILTVRGKGYMFAGADR
ncbi:response regulator [bacterium]|nr:response regulator [bacterium]